MTYIRFPHNENALNDQFSSLSHMAIKELWYICIHIHNTYIAVWTTVVFTPSTRCCQSAQGDNRTLYSSTTYSVYPSLVGCIILILLYSFRDNSSEKPPALPEFKGYGGKIKNFNSNIIYISLSVCLLRVSHLQQAWNTFELKRAELEFCNTISIKFIMTAKESHNAYIENPQSERETDLLI